jgi:hypothetical protein
MPWYQHSVAKEAEYGLCQRLVLTLFYLFRQSDLFSRFGNMLLNDAIYLWDESMSKLAEIKQNQTEMPSWGSLAPDVRREREERFVCIYAAATLAVLTSI